MSVGDQAWFEMKLAEIRQSKQQLRANLDATAGAEQFCEQALTALKAESQKADEAHGSGSEQPQP